MLLSLSNWLSDAMSGWRFAALAIFVLVFFQVLMVALLAIPPGDEGVGLFAREFRTWCFNYDPATGQMDWFYVIIMLVQPLFMAGLIYFIWQQQLQDAWGQVRREVVLVAGVAVLIVGLVGVTFAVLNDGSSEDGQYPFPAERLRTNIATTDFVLEDHTGEVVSLEELQGKVVLITAVYARCGLSCPIILATLKRVTDQLDDAQREDLVVLGITLDPEFDGPEELTVLANRHRVEPPLYRLLHGDPDEVNTILDDFSFARIPDEERDEIDHVNLFVLLDRDGDIAYRITLGDRTETWLPTALEVLLAEPPSGAAHQAAR